jgi:hypothetical protein
MKLPKAEQNLAEWQAATEALIMAAEGRGPLMHARVGMLRALNRNVERVFNPDRKDTHWGRPRCRHSRSILPGFGSSFALSQAGSVARSRNVFSVSQELKLQRD